MKSQFMKYFLSITTCLMLMLSHTVSTFAKPVSQPPSQEEVNAVIAGGFKYLATKINDDGGMRWADENSSAAASIRVVIALAAGGYSQNFLISNSGNRPIDYLNKYGLEWVNQIEAESPVFSVSRAGQLLTAVAAANANPRAFGKNSVNLIDEINRNYDPNTGIYGEAASDNVLDQVWAMLGLAANSAAVPAEAADWLSNTQLEDGSWNDGFGSYLDTTPLALMALLASFHQNVDSLDIQSAVNFLMANQDPNGGWQTEWDTTTNANTTSTILQALSAFEQPPMDESWTKTDGNPHTALLKLQQENGSIGGDFANTYSTADAIIGLSGNTLFNLGFIRKINFGFNFIATKQDSNGGWGNTGQTIDVLLALNAAGWDPNSITQQDITPLDYLASNLEAYLGSGPDAIAKSILGVTAAGENPFDFAGFNLVSALMETYDESKKAFGNPENSWHQSLPILCLHAAGAEIPGDAVDTLISLQREDGGWEYTPGFGTLPDTTALVLQALKATGGSQDDTVIQDGFAFIRAHQHQDGGWGDSSTTAFVMMALNTYEIPDDNWLSESGKAVKPALFAFQKPTGAFIYNLEYPEDNLMSTSAALIAAVGGSYLVEPMETQDTDYAGIVIDAGDGEAQTACVAFENDSISGLDLLDSSGFSYSSQDGFMDSIMGIANPEGETKYWSYWQWNGREWIFNTTGAGESTVLPGSIEAWNFTSWEIFPSLPPNHIPNLQKMCGARVLKNYVVQPHLIHEDLIPPSIEVTQIDGPEREELGEGPAITPKETPTTLQPAASGESEMPVRSLTPIIIIGGIGLIIVIVVVIALTKKRQ